jgi:hypothetical protein
MGQLCLFARTIAMIREIAGIAWSLPRSMSGTGLLCRYAIGRLRKYC